MALIFDVPVFSARQIVRHWWPNTPAGKKNGMRRIALLERSRLVQAKALHVKAIRGVNLLCAGPPDGAPWDYAQLSRESKRRWDLPIRRLTIVTATERARRIFGGMPRRRFHALHSLDHALGVSELYLEILRARPHLAERWIGEHEFAAPAFGEAQPDALITGAPGEPPTALEFAADYQSERYRRLQKAFANRYAFEIWGAA